MDLQKQIEPLVTFVENMPPVEQIPFYAGGLLRLLRTGVGIRVESRLNARSVQDLGPAYFDGVEASFFQEMTAYVLQGQGWELEVDGVFPQQPGGRWIYMMNHPTLLASWPPLHLASLHLAPHTGIVAKLDIKTNPITAFLLGTPLETIGRVGYINRDEREEAYLGVRRAVEAVLRPDTGLVFFPDSQRPYPKRLQKERKTWSEKRPDLQVDDWLTETCFPRSGGLWNLLQATETMPDVRFADFTVAEPHRRTGVFHVAYQERTRQEMLGAEPSLKHLQNWLIENWKEKNRVIREWRA